MTATLERTSLTAEQLARRTGWRRLLLEEILIELERAGLGARDNSGWRLSDKAEELYGKHLRRLELP